MFTYPTLLILFLRFKTGLPLAGIKNLRERSDKHFDRKTNGINSLQSMLSGLLGGLGGLGGGSNGGNSGSSDKVDLDFN